MLELRGFDNPKFRVFLDSDGLYHIWHLNNGPVHVIHCSYIESVYMYVEGGL